MAETRSLLAQHTEEIAGLHLAQREAADHQGADLVAAVAGGVHQHGHEGDQQGQADESLLVVGGDHAGEGCREHQDQQPGDTLLGVGPDAGAKVGGGIVVGQNSRHLLHILGALVGQDVDRIVDGDDTHEHPLVVHNGHGGKVVALHLTGHDTPGHP